MGYKTERRIVSSEMMVRVGAECDACGCLLGATYNNPDGSWVGGAANALPIVLRGYYGGYFDTIAHTPKVLFCAACARRLEELFPCIKKAIWSGVGEAGE
jgi:hypothetical protein